jgi:hypothetical protein
MKQFIILFLIIIPINAFKCFNQTECNPNIGSCEWFCDEGCSELSKDTNKPICVNNTGSDIVYSILYNQNLQFDNLNIFHQKYNALNKFLNSSEFNILKTKYRLDYDGSGTSCPYGCIEVNKECVPLNDNFICYQEKRLLCPSYCEYNSITNSCTTNITDIVCEIDNKNKTCPYDCNYKNDVCISDDPNVVCEFGYHTVCPFGCSINNKGECYSPNNYICHHIPEPKCPDSCSYDFNQKKCITNKKDPLSFCKPYIYAECPYDVYTINVSSVPQCNNNIDELCVFSIYNNIGKYNRNILAFPLDMVEKYKHISCKYSDVYCNNDVCNYGKCNSYVRQCLF